MLLYLVDKKCKKEYADYHLRKFVETEDDILNGSGLFLLVLVVFGGMVHIQITVKSYVSELLSCLI